MLLEKNLKKLLSELDHDRILQVPFGSNELTIKVFDDASKIILSTPVYSGGNFIPSSVRKCAQQRKIQPLDTNIKTELQIDENKFEISLKYLNEMDNIRKLNFTEILEDFSFIADDWRLILDENDRNDLVYITVK